MSKLPLWLVLLGLALLLATWLPACNRQPISTVGPESSALGTADLQAQAAAEATAIIQRAQATALVLQAQAQATVLLQQALAQESAPAAGATLALPVLTSTPGTPDADEPTPPVAETEEATGGADNIPAVELLAVGFAADGAFIIVSYRAPPVVAHTFWPGVLSVIDEASGTVFEEVPVMPVIGPLIGRPVEEGQVGYVMFVHAPPILRPGARVTVVLADYRFEHVLVQ